MKYKELKEEIKLRETYLKYTYGFDCQITYIENAKEDPDEIYEFFLSWSAYGTRTADDARKYAKFLEEAATHVDHLTDKYKGKIIEY